jgi:hypothetical protein
MHFTVSHTGFVCNFLIPHLPILTWFLSSCRFWPITVVLDSNPAHVSKEDNASFVSALRYSRPRLTPLPTLLFLPTSTLRSVTPAIPSRPTPKPTSSPRDPLAARPVALVPPPSAPPTRPTMIPRRTTLSPSLLRPAQEDTAVGARRAQCRPARWRRTAEPTTLTTMPTPTDERAGARRPVRATGVRGVEKS